MNRSPKPPKPKAARAEAAFSPVCIVMLKRLPDGSASVTGVTGYGDEWAPTSAEVAQALDRFFARARGGA